MVLDDAVLAVDRDPGKVADMLIRSRELVEQGGLAAVLVADERIGQQRAVGKGRAAALGVEPAPLAEAGMMDLYTARADAIATACPLCKATLARYSDRPVRDMAEIIDART